MALPITPPEQLRYRRFWTAGGVILLISILVISLIPYKGPILPVTISDKLLHMGAFTALAVWFSAVVPKAHWTGLFALLLAYGALIEVLQYFTSYRSFEWADFVADIGGLTAGWILISLGLSNWARWLEKLVVRND